MGTGGEGRSPLLREGTLRWEEDRPPFHCLQFHIRLSTDPPAAQHLALARGERRADGPGDAGAGAGMAGTGCVALPSAEVCAVQVHPAVLLNLCDAYVRRQEKAERVLGTLLGHVRGGTAQVRTSFAVPHEEDTSVALDTEFHTTMLVLHRKVNANERVIGWFSVGGQDLAANDTLFQGFYSTECARGIHLSVDAGLSEGGDLKVRGFVPLDVTVSGTKVADEFVEVPVEVLTEETERLGESLLSSNLSEHIPSGRSALQGSIRSLSAMLGRIQDKMGTLAGLDDIEAATVGRHLLETLPKPGQERSTEETQDLLALSYLAKVINVQVQLAEKLGTDSLPIA